MSLFSNYSDSQLIFLLQKANEDAFTEIYNRYWETLFAIAFHYSGSKELSEEVTQDIFMDLWNRRSAIVIKDLPAYLATSAKFAIFKQLLKIKRRKQLLEQGPAPVISLSEEETINARFLKEYLNGLVESLPEKCRIVYKYSRDEGMNIPEIAQAMNISDKTVESHLTKALKTLRSGLHHVKLWPFLFMLLIAVILTEI